MLASLVGPRMMPPSAYMSLTTPDIRRPCGMYPLALHLPLPIDDEKKYSAHMLVTTTDIHRPWGAYPLVLALPQRIDHAEKKYKVHRVPNSGGLNNSMYRRCQAMKLPTSSPKSVVPSGAAMSTSKSRCC